MSMKAIAGDINTRTGTTYDERRRIRKKYKEEQIKAKRGVRSRAVTQAYRSNYDAVDWRARIDQIENWEDREEAERIHKSNCFDPNCSCHL